MTGGRRERGGGQAVRSESARAAPSQHPVLRGMTPGNMIGVCGLLCICPDIHKRAHNTHACTLPPPPLPPTPPPHTHRSSSRFQCRRRLPSHPGLPTKLCAFRNQARRNKHYLVTTLLIITVSSFSKCFLGFASTLPQRPRSHHLPSC